MSQTQIHTQLLAASNAAGYIVGTLVQKGEAQFISSFNINSSSYVQVTPLNVTITPKASTNIIKLTFMGNCHTAVSGTDFFVTVKRGSTDLAPGTNGFVGISLLSGDNSECMSFTLYDSPSTTSPVTYSVWAKTSVTSNTAMGHGSNQAATMFLVEEIAQ